jgi:POT family proton-dependent oligopeptide transporter
MTIAANASTLPGPAAAPGEFFGQPRGLAYIAFTEAWERFSFYGMQALLVLYMTGHLLQPGQVESVAGFAGFRAAIEAVTGPLSPQALASQIFGLYVGLIYFTPVLGGLLGDRVIGRRRAVVGGAVLMALGHFLMAFQAAFLPALAALIVGAGLLKGNLAAQVGDLYAKDDSRRDGAFTIYCTAINVGATIAPLVCGTLGELYGWHYGFGAAGIGMLVGIAIYLSGYRYLPPENPAIRSGARLRLASGDGKTIFALLVVLGITALYWIAQAQVWNTYPIWLRDGVDRSIFGWNVPVTWFQSLDSLAVLLLAPVMIMIWRGQARRKTEPADLAKIAIGCGVFGSACLLLSIGETLAGSGKVALIWPVIFHFLCAIGYLYTAPIALALVSRDSPPAVNAMMVGAYYLGIFIGGIGSGWLGRFYEPIGPTGFWLIHAAISGAGTLLVLLLRRWLLDALRERVPSA